MAIPVGVSARLTAVVSTVLTDRNGGAVRITDFAPRYDSSAACFGRTAHQDDQAVAGRPHHRSLHTRRLRASLRHIPSAATIARYVHEGTVIRLTTDRRYPISRRSRSSSRPCTWCSGWTTVQDDLERDLPRILRPYHRLWMIGHPVFHLLRLAGRDHPRQITLKLSNFETSGIIAAPRPPFPSAGSGAPGTHCCRDAYFVVKALNRIGATQTWRFHLLHADIASNPNEIMRPVYGVVPIEPMDETTAPALKGYRGDGQCASAMRRPSRCRTIPGGSFLPPCPCSTTGVPRLGDEGLFRLLESLGAKAGELALEADNGIWEYRGRQRIHTHSIAMCWAGCHRLAAIASRLGLPDRAAHWNAVAEPVHQALLQGAWNEKRQAFTAAFGSDDLDASVLLLPDLGVIEAEDPRFVSTVKAMERELLREKHVMRYAAADDFGLPATAFLICRFWLVDAWWSLGRGEEAGDCLSTRGVSQSLWSTVGGYRPATRDTVGKLPTDLLHGWIDLDRDAAVAKLGGSILARLVVVSNRVAVPSRDSDNQAGGLAVAVRSLMKGRSGLWFGWSGTVAAQDDVTTRTIHQGEMSYVVTDLVDADYQEYYNGFANQVLWPILHYRLDLAEFSRRDLSGYRRVNAHFANELHTLLQPDDSSGCTTIIPFRQNAARPWSPKPHRLFPCMLSFAARTSRAKP